MEIRKATRKKAKLRLGISAPTGAGKTYSALLIASGIGPKVGLIDTENGSGDLYAETPTITEALPRGYDIIALSAPYDPKKYIDAISAFEQAGYDCIIVDSLSHGWSGAGGLLDKHGKESDRTGNGYTAWRKITPQHNELVDKILQSPCHIIVTLRAKTEYVQEKNEQGKTIVRKVGLAPVMRDGIEYEFTVFGELDQQHNFQASKDRTGTFGDSFQIPTKQMGERLLKWLNSGAEPEVIKPTNVGSNGQDLRTWAKSFADEIKAAETEEDITFLLAGAKMQLTNLEVALPAFYIRIMELSGERVDHLRANKPPKDINDDLPIKGYVKNDGSPVTAKEVDRMFDEAKAKNISALTKDMRQDELAEALAIPPALKRVK